MECPTIITNLLNYGVLPEKWSDLSVLLNETIISLEQLLLSSNLKELSIDVKEDYPFSSDRDAVIEKTKLSVISETLDSLKLLYNNLERRNGIHIKSFELTKREIDSNLRKRLKQLIKNCYDTFASLNNGAKSPYDLEAILDPDYFKQSLKTHPTNDLHGRAILFIKLAQSELEIIKESSETNEMQKVILTSYLDKLKTLNDPITSTSLVTTTSSSKKKSKSSKSNEIDKICEIMRKCQRLIKDVYGLMQFSNFKDYLNESDEIFNVINEKGCDAISDVCEFIEKIKADWIERDSENMTRATIRSIVLRRLNVNLKLTKKFGLCKDDLGSSNMILGLKNITTDILHIDVSFGDIYNGAYFLTFSRSPGTKPRIDVPSNFFRVDPVYEEIYEQPLNAFFIVYFHILKYYQFLESLDWNPFQYRKPWKLIDYLCDMQWDIEVIFDLNLNQDESYQISLDYADHYLMTKQKIHYDRETLEYRFDRFKPLKPYKFPMIHKILGFQQKFGSTHVLCDQLTDRFDGLISQLNRKVTNRGQLIIFERAMAMMTRSIYLFRIMRYDVYPHDADTFNKLIRITCFCSLNTLYLIDLMCS
ncbi:uncharacterized protein LOC107359339 [Tetranychus urticae]|uniref:uncharacterized protein LOC107359339 n=1 Tax=Tetranychus urticae TaxID=32264 RepID=UPI00077BD9DA|nr:uncharacterized protein LOC107359339 [Tetranychus urticae]